MRLISLLLLAVALSCQQGSAVPSAYRADLENICDAEARSGALGPEQNPNQRSILVARWIAGRIQTEEGQRFLGSLAKLAPAAKGDALRREAARAGLSGCALADTWR